MVLHYLKLFVSTRWSIWSLNFSLDLMALLRGSKMGDTYLVPITHIMY